MTSRDSSPNIQDDSCRVDSKVRPDSYQRVLGHVNQTLIVRHDMACIPSGESPDDCGRELLPCFYGRLRRCSFFLRCWWQWSPALKGIASPAFAVKLDCTCFSNCAHLPTGNQCSFALLFPVRLGLRCGEGNAVRAETFASIIVIVINVL